MKLSSNQLESNSNQFGSSWLLWFRFDNFFPGLRFALIAFDLNRLIFIDLSVSPLSLKCESVFSHFGSEKKPTETSSLPLVRGALVPLSWYSSLKRRLPTQLESTYSGCGRMDRWLLSTLAYIRFELTNRTDSTANPLTQVGR